MNRPRSSARSIASTLVPRTLTPCFSKTPLSASSVPQLRAVWPPKPRRTPSGFSFSMTPSTNSGVMGRKYALSPTNLGSVWMVATLGLTRTTSTPSSFSALIAWEPE